jgi:hypothetical protein
VLAIIGCVDNSGGVHLGLLILATGHKSQVALRFLPCLYRNPVLGALPQSRTQTLLPRPSSPPRRKEAPLHRRSRWPRRQPAIGGANHPHSHPAPAPRAPVPLFWPQEGNREIDLTPRVVITISLDILRFFKNIPFCLGEVPTDSTPARTYAPKNSKSIFRRRVSHRGLVPGRTENVNFEGRLPCHVAPSNASRMP